MELENFGKLEERIGGLLKTYEELKAKNNTLKEELKLKELKIKEFKERLERSEKEKGVVREKVDGLITRLDGLIQNV
ncbi:MAG: cell division protein ZapB [Deltaproteobacteria bacterium]|nr:cell division protein ZapB [Deltaproteobacteria bacterium]